MNEFFRRIIPKVQSLILDLADVRHADTDAIGQLTLSESLLFSQIADFWAKVYPGHFHISQHGADCRSVTSKVCCRDFLVNTPESCRNEIRVSHFVEQIEQAIGQAAGQYYRLVIIAGLPGSGKTAALQQIASRLSSAIVNVNRELSQRMLEMTRSQRSRQVERLLREVIAGIPGDVILLDNMEILFDPELEVDPLRLLQLSSRNRTLVATWNGSFMAGSLTYAEPGHPEFQQFKQPDAVIISRT